jgi:AI-2 transport protein TqsA
MIGDRIAGAAAMILTESEEWREKVAATTKPRTGWRLTESADVIAGKIRSYLILRTALGLATAVLYGLWLWFMGVDLVLV